MRRGVDDDGVAGLDHAIGLRLAAVLSGRERIVSARRRDAGVVTRLATARVGIGRKGPWLIEAMGRSGKRPPPEAVKLLDAYVASLAADPSSVKAPSVATTGDDPIVTHGYDPAAPGAWEAVHGMFEEMLPRSLQDVTMGQLAAMALGVDARMPGMDGPMGGYEVFEFGFDTDPADVEAMLARMAELDAPKP